MLINRFPCVLALLLGAAFLFVPAASGDVVTRDVEYELPNGRTARGMVVYDDERDGRRPGVLVIPEWWGLNDYPIRRARQLAEMGYVAFVADMYGDRIVTDNARRAQELSSQAREAGLAALARPALEQLKQVEQVDPERIAAIGFCFGGTTVIDLAVDGEELAGVVSFHGTIGPDDAPRAGEEVKTPMLILHGGADPFVPPQQLAAFMERCLAVDAPVSLVSFPNAVHAFTNPDADEAGLNGVAYQEEAAEASWEIMRHFLGMVFGEARQSGDRR